MKVIFKKLEDIKCRSSHNFTLIGNMEYLFDGVTERDVESIGTNFYDGEFHYIDKKLKCNWSIDKGWIEEVSVFGDIMKMFDLEL